MLTLLGVVVAIDIPCAYRQWAVQWRLNRRLFTGVWWRQGWTFLLPVKLRCILIHGCQRVSSLPSYRT